MSTRWDYKTLRVTGRGLLRWTPDDAALELALKEHGEAGWELVSVILADGQYVAVFKRSR